MPLVAQGFVGHGTRRSLELLWWWWWLEGEGTVPIPPPALSTRRGSTNVRGFAATNWKLEEVSQGDFPWLQFLRDKCCPSRLCCRCSGGGEVLNACKPHGFIQGWWDAAFSCRLLL